LEAHRTILIRNTATQLFSTLEAHPLAAIQALLNLNFC